MDRLTVANIKKFLVRYNKKITGNKAELFSRMTEVIAEEGLNLENVIDDLIRDQQTIGLDSKGQGCIEDEARSVVSSLGSKRSRNRSEVSRRSVVRSEVSSVGSIAAVAVAKKAALKAKHEKLKKLEEVARQKLLLEQEGTRLELEAEMAACDAEVEVLSRAAEELNIPVQRTIQVSAAEDNSQAVRTPLSGQFKPNMHSSNPTEFTIPERRNPGSLTDDRGILNTLIACSVKSHLPLQELGKFGGDYTRYYEFVRAFDTMISSKVESDEEKLQYLTQYTTGQANEIVRACLHLDPRIGYAEARALMQKRYGNTEMICASYMERILSWRDIRQDEVEALDEFAIALANCRNAVRNIGSGNHELENSRTLRVLVSKLPFCMQDRWRRKVDDIIQSGRMVKFENLVTFIETEARIVRNPMFGRCALEKQKQRTNQNVTYKTSDSARVKLYCNQTQGIPVCKICEKDHVTHICGELSSKNHDEKVEIIRRKNLCFSCLGEGHLSKGCRNRSICSICERKHPTVLHRTSYREGSGPQDVKADVQGASDSPSDDHVTVFTNLVSNAVGEMTIVPVKVKYGEREIVTNAYIDNGSSVSFCKISLLNRLRLSMENFDEVKLDIGTMIGTQSMPCVNVPGLTISDIDMNNEIRLPPIYGVPQLPVEGATAYKRKDFAQWAHLQDVPMVQSDSEVEIMLGSNIPEAIEPWEVVHSSHPGAPYAVRTKLGWIVCGQVRGRDSKATVNRVMARVNNYLDKELIASYNKDFQDLASAKRELSSDDRDWLKNIDQHCIMRNGRYQIPLPLRDSELNKLPDTKPVAYKRLRTLERKLNDEFYAKQYKEFMVSLLEKGYAEEVPVYDVNKQRKWYIPHFGVYHPEKPDKVRVVFDCAAKVGGLSLNDVIRPGPDINNQLLGVLLRFRLGLHAYSADVETMFYQVRVAEKDRDYLRFLWWADGEVGSEIMEYRMKSHPFGACSSPAIANFALKRVVHDFGENFSKQACDVILHGFYVDDCMQSLDEVTDLITNGKEVMELCSRGGFNLTKFNSPSHEFLQTLPSEKLSKGMKEYLIDKRSRIIKALGLSWKIPTDSLGAVFKGVTLPHTKRELLSCVASVYDPLGILAPLVLEGRIILQNLCRMKLDWDAAINGETMQRILSWFLKLKENKNVAIQRCMKPCKLVDVRSIQWHIFADASQEGYGAVAYLRIVNNRGQRNVSFVMGKSKVVPLKAVTVPRLELVAAMLAVKLKAILEQELTLEFTNLYFWTDSTTVLKYLTNNQLRFHTFVANRVAFILDGSVSSQWHYVPSKLNPADDSSRAKQSVRWIKGPEFLRLDEESWPVMPELRLDSVDNLEVRRVLTTVSRDKAEMVDLPFRKFIQYFSSWMRLLKCSAWLILFVQFVGRTLKKPQRITVPLMEKAKQCIIKYVQGFSFPEEVHTLKDSQNIKPSSSIARLKPVMINELVRVGGRLCNMDLPFEERHPIILPNKGHITDLVINHYHVKVGHMGRQMVLAAIRTTFWIVNGNSAVRRVLSKCVSCKKFKSKVMEQEMAPLPTDRAAMNQPPFYVSGLDCFGPYFVKVGRSQVKRYGLIFTCLTIRAIHLEVVADMSSASFINAFRRFLSRRGQVHKIISDRGTNFVGGNKNMKAHGYLEDDLQKEAMRQMIEWEFTPPGASHFGGVWERMIGSVRRILEHLVGRQSLSDDTLVTLFCEVESIINSRPLTVVSTDPNDSVPITPNKLLNMNNSSTPLLVDTKINYAKNRWKQVQYLAEQFWIQWKKEYFLGLQQRQRWLTRKRNISVEDIVLVVDDCHPRSHWALARVVSVNYSSDGLARSAKIRRGNKVLERPISKLIMLLENDTE